MSAGSRRAAVSGREAAAATERQQAVGSRQRRVARTLMNSEPKSMPMTAASAGALPIVSSATSSARAATADAKRNDSMADDAGAGTTAPET